MVPKTIELPTSKPVTWIESGREGGIVSCYLAIDLLGYNDDFVQLTGTPCDDPDKILYVFVRSYLVEQPNMMFIPAFSYEDRDGLVRFDIRLDFESTADRVLVEEAITEMLAHSIK